MNLQERGTLFVGPGEEVYEGMVVGENARADDLDVNATQGEAPRRTSAPRPPTCWSGSSRTATLSLDQALEFLREDECVEATPDSVRLRKVVLDKTDRVKVARRARSGAATE